MQSHCESPAWCRLIAALTMLLASGIAAAQPCPERGWELQLGLGGGYTPDYIGSRGSSATIVPFIEGRWCTESLGSVRIDTAGTTLGSGTLTWAFIDRYDVSFGLQLGLRPSRKDKSRSVLRLDEGSPTLKGLDTIEGTVDFGAALVVNLFGEVPLFVQARTAGGGDGWVVETGLYLEGPLKKRLSVGLIPGFTWADSSAMQRYFGVTPAESARSAFGVYQPGSSAVGVSLELFAEYIIAGPWSVIVDVGYTRLLSGAASSPIVQQSDQISSYALFAYRF